MFLVQRRMCQSCIYCRDSPLDIAKLEADIADPHMEGYFAGYRECHHAKRGSGVCCHGFWRRHRDKFTLGQIAQRLKLVRFVTVDFLKRQARHGKNAE